MLESLFKKPPKIDTVQVDIRTMYEEMGGEAELGPYDEYVTILSRLGEKLCGAIKILPGGSVRAHFSSDPRGRGGIYIEDKST